MNVSSSDITSNTVCCGVFRKFYQCLAAILSEDVIDKIISEDIVDISEVEEITGTDKSKQKAVYILRKIERSLDCGVTETFYRLLSILDGHGGDVAILATRIRKKLIAADKGKSTGKNIPPKKQDVLVTPWSDVKLELLGNRDVERNTAGKEFSLDPTILQLTTKIVPSVAQHWYDLGLKLLGDKYSVLLNIIAKYDNCDERCCAKMFTKWLEDQSCNASWDQLFSAVRAIGLGKVASALEQQLLLDDATDYLQHLYKTYSGTYREPWSTTENKLCAIDVLKKTYKNTTNYPSGIQNANSKCNTKFQKLTDVEILFDGNDDPRVILIEGAPGIGKTIISKNICSKWAKGKLLNHCQLLFFVPLRDPAVQSITKLQELSEYVTQSAIMAKQLYNYFKSVNGNGVLFIFDGFDEINTKLRRSSFQELILEKHLTKARIIVTSRPSASASLHHLVDQKIEILGFDHSSRQQYVTEALQSFPQISNLVKFFQQHSIIDAFCSIPLTISILTYLYLEQPDDLPTTATEMCEKFVLLTILKMQKGIVINKMEQLPLAVHETLQQLRAFAFQCLRQDKIVFTAEDLPEIAKKNPTWYGLLKSVEHCNDPTPTCSLNFLHFSLVEYFAACYVASLSKIEVYELLSNSFLTTDSKYSSMRARLSNMWIYYFGITGGKCASLRHYLASYTQYNQHTISTHCPFSSASLSPNASCTTIPSGQNAAVYANDEVQCCNATQEELSLNLKEIVKNPLNVLYLFQCFQEAKDFELCEILANSFIDNTINLTGHQLSLPNQLIPLGVFLSKSSLTDCRELNLCKCHIGDHGIYLLWQYVCKRMLVIVTIDLMENNLTEASMPFVINLASHLRLQTLKLGNNCVVVPPDAASKFSSLKNLYLWCCNITTSSAAAIAKVVRNLKKLNIGNNKLGDDGAELLSEGLGNAPMLQVLNLNNNKIGPRGAVAIAHALSDNNSLEVLNISNNPIGEEGAKAIAKTIGSIRTLKRFLLYGDTSLDEDLAMLIVKSLSGNVSITNIGFPEKFADDNCIKSLVEHVNVGRDKSHKQKLVLKFV